MNRKGQAAGPYSAFSTASSNLSYLSETPSFTSIPNANVVVSFKNLSKKDPVTKAKALEELIAHVAAHPGGEEDGGVDDGILEAWVAMYPRTSIDNSRRVRELSHAFQLTLLHSVRRRMEKHIPQTVGPWLSALYDRDKGVVRTASEGSAAFLSTPEKTAQFWRRCRSDILSYASKALDETRDTLSDERSTSKDDAEAKFARVVASSLHLVCGVLEKAGDGIDGVDAFLDILGRECTWNAVADHNPAVRQAACQLLVLCIDHDVAALDAQLPKLRQAFLVDGLKRLQAGSAAEFVDALRRLTERYPDIWTARPDDRKGPAPALRLHGLIEKGSQGSAGIFWERLAKLLAAMPHAVVTPEWAARCLGAMRVGITRREEPKNHALLGWKYYLDTILVFCGMLGGSNDKLELASANLFPLFQQYLFPLPDRAEFTVSSSPLTILLASCDLVLRLGSKDVEDGLANLFGTHAAVLSKYASSPLEFGEQLRETGDRWFALAEATHKQTAPRSLVHGKISLAPPSWAIIRTFIQVLRAEKCRSSFLASVLESSGKRTPDIWVADPAVPAFLRDLSLQEGELRVALDSESAPHLLECLNITRSLPALQHTHTAIWLSWIGVLLPTDRGGEDPPRPAFLSLLSNPAAEPHPQTHARLQSHLLHHGTSLIDGESADDDSWEIFEVSLRSGVFSKDSLRHVIGEIIRVLSEGRFSDPVRALHLIATHDPAAFDMDDHLSVFLLATVMRLTDAAAAAGDVYALDRLSTIRSAASRSKSNVRPAVAVIMEDLEESGPKSIHVTHLAVLAISAPAPFRELFPSPQLWLASLDFALSRPIPNGFALGPTGALGRARSLIRPPGPPVQRHVPRDPSGCSRPARMAWYTSKIMLGAGLLHTLPSDFVGETMFLIGITNILARRQICTLEKGLLWEDITAPGVRNDVDSFVESSQRCLDLFWLPSDDVFSSPLFVSLFRCAGSLTPLGFHSAEVLHDLVAADAKRSRNLPAADRPKPADDRLSGFDVWGASPPTATTILPTLAITYALGLRAYGKPLPAVRTLTNRMLSFVGGADVASETTPMAMLLLHAGLLAYLQGGEGAALPKSRILYAVRRITAWTDDPEALEAPLAATICLCLDMLLPCIGDVYGAHWAKSVEFCVNEFTRAANASYEACLDGVTAALVLYRTLAERIPEQNDDRTDALAAHSEQVSEALIGLLRFPRDVNCSVEVRLFDMTLGTLLKTVPLAHVTDLAPFWRHLATEQLQESVFVVLDRKCSEEQERLAVDALLDGADAKLPAALVSLLHDTPPPEGYPGIAPDELAPQLRGYLLTWKILFNVFAVAPSKLRRDYTEQLRTENVLPAFLDCVFDRLGHTVGVPIDLAQLAGVLTAHMGCSPSTVLGVEELVRTFRPVGDHRYARFAGMDDLDWLAVHLAFLALRYCPSLFRAWWLSSRCPRTTYQSVETWVTKWLAPIIIEETISDISTWAKSQTRDDASDKELLVKVSQAARLATAGYEVDDQMATICITLPENYPLEGVTVESVHRVAVSESKWQGWLMATRGVITFSNGSIIDGLMAFKRNISGALKGQSECAICYSIISADRKVPDKRCDTCKNLFHRTCLYKWFQTSSQNTCPLCRNPIDYLGAPRPPRGGEA